jgi:hypothetical protein
VEQRTAGSGVDLLAKPADMNIDHIGLRVEMVLPDIFEEYRTGYDLIGVTRQQSAATECEALDCGTVSISTLVPSITPSTAPPIAALEPV